ncbi:MAG TPA: S8 family serine peptidase, partial [Blastocatellia bacterium]|nr:S8 family serine peptidase [Blastocatellia bacterium]
RNKPDIVAPGTHVQGAASQDPLNSGDGVCGLPGTGVDNIYFPRGQKLYTWSSGTSHSAPMVAGAAALAFQFLKTQLGSDPSPALVKALLLNSARYLTGQGGGDNLPGARQGWGFLDLGRAFGTTDRIVLDEDPSRTFTTSGGAPFEVVGSIGNAGDEFRVMVVWTDPAGNSMTNAPFVNQLNLEVVVNGVTYRGNNFNKQYSVVGGNTDIFNNVQAVRLPAGVTGSFVVRVRPTVIAGDGVPGNSTDLDQDFALVVTNGRQAAVPVLTVNTVQGISAGVTVQHSTGSDNSLLPGEQARVTVTVNNDSPTAAGTVSSARLLLILPDGTSLASGTSTWPTIAANGSASNESPFVIQVPSSLRCGSIAQLELQLTTPEGLVRLPVGIRVGRPILTLVQVVLLSDDVDSGSVKWKLKKFTIADGVANSGTKSYRAVDSGSTTNDVQLSTLLEKKQVAIPANAGNVRMSFFHVFNFEPGFDGGVLEVSTDGGDTWQDLGSRAIAGGYDGKVTPDSKNPLGSRRSWTARGKAGVFNRVVIDLDAFAGQTIRLRFLAGFDEATGIADGYTGWFIDDIRITIDQFSCAGQESAEATSSNSPSTETEYGEGTKVFPESAVSEDGLLRLEQRVRQRAVRKRGQPSGR